MQRSILVTLIAAAVGGVLYLVFRDKPEKPEEAAALAAPAKKEVIPATTITAGSGETAFHVVISHRGAGLQNVLLDSAQYAQKDRLHTLSARAQQLAKSGLIDPAKFVPGPYDLVETWSPGFYPFQVQLRKLEWTDKTRTMERLIRAAREVEVGKEGVTVGPAQTGDLAVQAGDRLVIDGVGEWAIATATETAVTLAPAAAAAKAGAPAAAAAPVGKAVGKIIRRGTPAEQWAKDTTFTAVASSVSEVTLVWPNPTRDQSDLFIERTWAARDGYHVEHAIRVRNLSVDALQADYSVVLNGWVDPWAEPPGMFTPPIKHWAPACHVGGTKTEEAFSSLLGEESREIAVEGKVEWFALNSQYFLLAAIFSGEEGIQGLCRMTAAENGVIAAEFTPTSMKPQEGSAAACVPEWLPAEQRGGRLTCADAMKKLGVDDTHLDRASLDRAVTAFTGDRDEAAKLRAMVEGYARFTQNPGLVFTVFAGPKELKALEATAASLVGTLDFWYVGFLARPMLWLLKVIHNGIGSWWVAIFLLTVIVRGVMFPLTHRQAVQMQRMQDLKPELDEIQKKYGADKQRLQQEMLNLYKRAGVNPLGGCFPILLQMPVYIALYRCIYSAVDLYQAPLFGWVYDMTQPDPYYILPVLLGVFMLLQQRFMPASPGADPLQQKIIQYVMPAMFSVFMLVLPAGLVFYIFVSTAIGVGQSYWIKQKFGGKLTPSRGKA